MDKITALIVWFMIYLSRFARIFSKFGLIEYDSWQKGKKLKILLVGYNGERNTGADVRVATIVEQFEILLGKDNIEISILTQNVENIQVYFSDDIKLIRFSSLFFFDVYKACSKCHMTVLCEGSTLKSKFANALTLFFFEAAGIMKVQGKPCIAYGSEAGEMDWYIKFLAKRICSDTYFIARTLESLKIINDLGIKGHLGTDTAWTFKASKVSKEVEEVLTKSGWDGKKPLLGVALINPFWWPIKPSIIKLAKAYITRDWSYHSKKWYFYSWSEKRKNQYNNYLTSIAEVINECSDNEKFFPVLIAMEALDRRACEDCNRLLNKQVPIFLSEQYDGYMITALLRSLSMLITSRYHARVLSMEMQVPAVAISMDERLENIFAELLHKDDYLIRVDDNNLKEKLKISLDKACANKDQISRQLKDKLPYYHSKMDEMGDFMKKFVMEKFPI